MRALISPDSFGDTLTAVAAADAIAAGWMLGRPGDEVVRAPLSDGGPGFVDVLATRFGEVVTTTVRGPLDDPVDARWLRHETAGRVTAYIECAQACGLHQVGHPSPDTAWAASTHGVGELVVAALAQGATTVVVGLGGSSTTDGGVGMLEALAAAAGATGADLAAAADLAAPLDLIVASDVENPLLGESGAAHVFGPQKGADADTVVRLEARMEQVNERLTALAGRAVADEPGAGAAGGLGAALLALGGRRVSGATVIADAIDFEALVTASDVLITGEGRFDTQTLRGKVVAAAAAAAAGHSVPVLVVAGQVTLERSAIADAGIAAAHAIVDIADSTEHAMGEAGPLLERLVADVARGWTARHTAPGGPSE
ncbi:glycerate kinase family protein [Williamsia sp. MIQD14]|uniref:glycerate kinase family protein n=1 Tax=Williamsia sp. MIQD14 TaxID=3425703 RepID=UPI003DA077EB